MDSKTLTIDQWKIKSEDKHLRIKDILAMAEGKYKIFHKDRNFYDLLDYDLKGPNNMSDITKNNYKSIFTKTSSNNIIGNLLWIDSETQTRLEEKFKWHVDLGHCWYPLDNNGKVPLFDEDGIINIGEHAGKHWSDLDENTLVGWRGPCILQEHIDTFGKVIVPE